MIFVRRPMECKQTLSNKHLVDGKRIHNAIVNNCIDDEKKEKKIWRGRRGFSEVRAPAGKGRAVELSNVEARVETCFASAHQRTNVPAYQNPWRPHQGGNDVQHARKDERDEWPGSVVGDSARAPRKKVRSRASEKFKVYVDSLTALGISE